MIKIRYEKFTRGEISRHLERGVNDLETYCIKNGREDLLKEWSKAKNGNLTPRDIKCNSADKVWWKCPICRLEYPAAVSSRVGYGTKCPACAGKKVYTGYNDLETYCMQHDREELLAEWDYDMNGDLTPRDITRGYTPKVWWKCPRGHESYLATAISRIAYFTGCPECARRRTVSLPEKLVFYYLEKTLGDKYKIIPSDRKALKVGRRGGMELDIYIPDLGIGIEYDGAYYHDKNDQERELAKNALCKEKGIDLIRVRESGLSTMNGCYCVMRDNNSSMRDLDRCVKETLDCISNIAGIDINYDGNFINCNRDRAEAIRLRNNK